MQNGMAFSERSELLKVPFLLAEDLIMFSFHSCYYHCIISKTHQFISFPVILIVPVYYFIDLSFVSFKCYREHQVLLTDLKLILALNVTLPGFYIQ